MSSGTKCFTYNSSGRRLITSGMAIEPHAWHSASITTGAIKVATLESLQAKIKRLQQQAEALIAKQSSGVIERIRDLMEKHGITTADIDAHAGGKQRAKPATP